MRDIFEKLCKLLFVMYDPRDAIPVLKAADRLIAGQWLSRNAIDNLQRKKLGRLVEHAARHIPGYRDLLGPLSGSAATEIRKLPVMTKQILRASPKQMVAGNIPERSIRYSVTGGTTGEPMQVAKSLGTVIIGEGAYMRGRSWAGIRQGDKSVILKGSEKASLLGKLRAKLVNQVHLEGFQNSSGSLTRLVEQVRRIKPAFVTGYPTTLLRFAEAAENHGVSVPVVLSTGEMLTENQRRLLESVFGARVFDHYGSNEVTSLAYECEKGVKHITEEHVIIETVDESDQPVVDRLGRILVTDLDNFAMPFIRYDIGDIGVLSRVPCICGRNHLVLKSLEGRAQDLLRTRNGSVLPAMYFISQFGHLQGIRSYQLVQRNFDAIELRYVARNATGEREAARIHDAIRDKLGNEITVTMVKKKQIALTARGKSRLVVGLGNLNAATGRQNACDQAITV